MQLTFKNAQGITFAFDPQSQQWTAHQEGEKPTSSQQLDVLQTRLSKRATAPSKASESRPEPIATGMAGVVKPNSYEQWTFKVSGLDTKLDWDPAAKQVKVARYRKPTAEANWESASLRQVLLDPDVFEPEDIALIQDMMRIQAVRQAVAEGEQALAQAWVAQQPIRSQLVQMSGRPERHNAAGLCTQESTPIAHRPASYDSSSSANKVVLDPAWPLITAAPSFQVTDAELAAWTDEGVKGWKHASGVRLAIATLASSAEFAVSRPSATGAQTVFTSRNFVTAFRVAQATAQVAEQAPVPIEAWLGSARWAEQDDPSWPVRVTTEACLMLFPASSDSVVRASLEAYVLQAVEPRDGVPSAAPRHATWVLRSGNQTEHYRAVSDQDAQVLEARAALRRHGGQVAVLTQEAKTQFSARMDQLHQASVTRAYQDGCDGTLRARAQAVSRLEKFFERLSQAVNQEPALIALAIHVAQLKVRPLGLSLAESVSSLERPDGQLADASVFVPDTGAAEFSLPDSPAAEAAVGRRQAAPARRRPR
jgi:hypothetical protein